tara:strand:- start:221 stop:517 length:297 start_codon:yes stop_codon:yes gene_type:complete
MDYKKVQRVSSVAGSTGPFTGRVKGVLMHYGARCTFKDQYGEQFELSNLRQVDSNIGANDAKPTIFPISVREAVDQGPTDTAGNLLPTTGITGCYILY